MPKPTSPFGNVNAIRDALLGGGLGNRTKTKPPDQKIAELPEIIHISLRENALCLDFILHNKPPAPEHLIALCHREFGDGINITFSQGAIMQLAQTKFIINANIAWATAFCEAKEIANVDKHGDSTSVWSVVIKAKIV